MIRSITEARGARGEERIVPVELTSVNSELFTWAIMPQSKKLPSQRPHDDRGHDHVHRTLAKGRASPFRKARKATFIAADRQEVKKREFIWSATLISI